MTEGQVENLEYIRKLAKSIVPKTYVEKDILSAIVKTVDTILLQSEIEIER